MPDVRGIRITVVGLCLTVIALAPMDANGDEQEAELPRISLERETFDGFPLITATVTRDGEPIEGVTVGFYVQRAFGHLELGTEQTWGDGTASADFPEGLPGDEQGRFGVEARILEPSEYEGITEQITVAGGVPLAAVDQPLPRTMWAPQPPIPLLLTIGALLAGVWITYVFVLTQLVKIRMEKPV